MTPEECYVGQRVTARDSVGPLYGEVIKKAPLFASVRWDNGIIGYPFYVAILGEGSAPWNEPKPCPECGYPIRVKWSGVACTHCDWWFCL